MTSTNEKADLGAVKLACRDLWKIYGVTPREAAEIAGASRNDGNKSTSGSNPVAAVAGATLDIHEAEIFVLMGLSGSGKSTLLRCLTRLIEPSYGSVTFDGEDLLAAGRQRMTEIRRQAMGMVFQNFGLLPHLTVLDNVAFPLRVQGIDRAKREARAREMTELVGLKGREGQYPRELSGGQQQRVGIARSLAAEPEIWFLDEPFSALDPLIRRQMQDEFIRLQKMLRKRSFLSLTTFRRRSGSRTGLPSCVMEQLFRSAHLLKSPSPQPTTTLPNSCATSRFLKLFGRQT